MNIVLFGHNGKFHYFRPDISLNRGGNDYFCPDGITELAVTPFIYLKMERAAKAVSARFAPRYYREAGYGLHLTATQLEQPGDPVSWHTARSLDSTLYVAPAVPLEQFSCPPELQSAEALRLPEGLFRLFDRQLETVSLRSWLRAGDFVCLELPEKGSVCRQETAREGRSPVRLGGLYFDIIW